MKKITEQSLVEMSRNLKTRLNETAANQQDSISSKVGAFGTNAYSTISNSVGDFIQGMRGRKAGKDRPYYNGHDGSYYITDTNGNPEPISPENRPDLVRGDANKKPFYFKRGLYHHEKITRATGCIRLFFSIKHG